MSTLKIEQKESAIEERFKRLCQAEGWLVRKYTTPGHAGAPDRIVIANPGVVGWAELKRPTKDLEPHQEIEIDRMRKQGAFVMRVRNTEELAQFIATMRRRVEARRAEGL